MALKYKRAGTRTLTGIPGGSFGLERPDSTTLFSLGSFRVTGNLRPSRLADPAFEPVRVGTVTDRVSLADLQVESLEQARLALRYQRQLRLPQDPAELGNYATFGSLRQRLRSALRGAALNFPAGLVAEPVRPDGTRVSTVVTYTYDPNQRRTSVALAVDRLLNPFALNVHALGREQRPGQADLLTSPGTYVLVYNEVEFPLVSIEGLTNAQTSLLRVVVTGDPFLGLPAGSLGVSLLIRPNARAARAQFRAKTSELGIYLLGGPQAPFPGAPPVLFRLPVDGVVFDDPEPVVDEVYVQWPRPDGYNIAIDGVSFATFSDQVETLGEILDEYKSDLLVSRYTPPDSILALDQTSGGKIPALLRIWGRQLDDTKGFIDALVRVNHLDYAPSRGLPEQLIRNLATTLGWKVDRLLDEDQLLDRLYAPGLSTPTGTDASVLPADLDAELWRRIALNTHWFLQAKGTRMPIESMLDLLGIPTGLLRFNEHAFLLEPSQRRLPAAPVSDLAGFGEEIDDLPVVPPVYHNTGPSANYYDQYAAEGKLRRVVDNRKVWVAPTAQELADGYERLDAAREVSYPVGLGTRVLPSKEVTLSVSPVHAWELAFQKYCLEQGLPGTGRLGSLRQREDFTPVPESLASFMERLYTRLVDARSRKTTVGYPTLRGLLTAYEQEAGVQAASLPALLAYTAKLNRYFKQLVSQLLPATTLLRQQAIAVGNTDVSANKHRYRKGVSAGSEFVTPVVFPPHANIPLAGFGAEVLDPLEVTYPGPQMDMVVRTGSDALTLLRTRHPLRPRLNAKALVIAYPTQQVQFLLTLSANAPVPAPVVCRFVDQTTSKVFVVSAPASAVTPQPDPRGASYPLLPAAKRMGYAVYEARTGQPLNLVIREVVEPAAYVVSAGTASVTVTVDRALLLADREYLVKTFFQAVIHRGSAAAVPPLPWDAAEEFRLSTYPALYRRNAKFVDPASPGHDVDVSNENNNALPGTYFNNYRAGRDYYFPTIIPASVPQLTTEPGTRPLEVYTETMPAATAANTYPTIVLTYRALDVPVLRLNGGVLVTGSDYHSAYPAGHPLEFQSFVLNLPTNPGSVVTATYRTGFVPLSLLSERYDLRSSPTVYVDLNAGQTVPAGVRAFLVGTPSTVPPAVGFVTSQPVIQGSAQAYLNGTAMSGATTETLTLPTAGTVRVAGVVFQPLSGGKRPTSEDDFELRYGTVDARVKDVLTVPVSNWVLPWRVSDRYPSDVYPARVDHGFKVEVAAPGDYAFTGVVKTLAEVAYDPSGELAAEINLSLLATPLGLVQGNLYPLRVRATKGLHLVHGTILSEVQASGVYQFRMPSMPLVISN